MKKKNVILRDLESDRQIDSQKERTKKVKRKKNKN